MDEIVSVPFVPLSLGRLYRESQKTCDWPISLLYIRDFINKLGFKGFNQPIRIQTQLLKCSYFYINNVKVCRSLIGHRLCMSVFDVSLIKHACRSPT